MTNEPDPVNSLAQVYLYVICFTRKVKESNIKNTSVYKMNGCYHNSITNKYIV